MARIDGNRMFVMLGQRAKNGRISKNEKYKLLEFVEKTFPDCPKVLEQPVSLYDRIFKTKKYQQSKLLEKLIMYEELKMAFLIRLVELIEQDEVGRKKK